MASELAYKESSKGSETYCGQLCHHRFQILTIYGRPYGSLDDIKAAKILTISPDYLATVEYTAMYTTMNSGVVVNGYSSLGVHTINICIYMV